MQAGAMACRGIVTNIYRNEIIVERQNGIIPQQCPYKAMKMMVDNVGLRSQLQQKC
jgi:hypothetical protein